MMRIRQARRTIGACAIGLITAASAPGAEQWEWLGLSDPGAKCIAVAPGDSSLIVAGGSTLHVSENLGQTWTTASGISEVWCIAFGSSKQAAFVGTWGGGIYHGTNGCRSWTQFNSGLGNWVVKSVVVRPWDDSHIYAGAENGLYESVGGNAWFLLKAGVNVGAIAVSPGNPQVMYMGTWGGGFWKSTNGGAAWSLVGTDSLPAGGDCQGIAIDPADDRVVYAVFQGGGVWVTFDAGAGWAQVTPGFEGCSVATDPHRPGFLYGVGGWTVPQRSGCYGGVTGWQSMSAGWNGGWFARGIGMDPNDAHRVYAAAGNAGFVRWVADTESPEPAGALSATAAGSAVLLSWVASDSSDCTGYWVYRRAGGAAYPPTPSFLVNGRETTSYADTNVVAGIDYHYRVAAIDDAQNRSDPSNEAGASVEASYDLDVAFITRLPRDCRPYRLEYPEGIPTLAAGSENDKRWPAAGELVTFEAHVVNRGTAATPPAACRWKINGEVVRAGTLGAINPGQEGTASLEWAWNADGLDTDHTDQTLTFEVDPDGQVLETFEQNNNLSDFLEGLGLWIYVDRPIYEAFNARLNFTGTRSFEDWIQAQFRAMNANFARSTYSLAPRGCLERVRIDRIVVGPMIDDGPPTADGRWQFSGDVGYADFADRVDGGLIHELMHQLGVIDLYQMPVTPPHNLVLTPDGLPVGMGFGFGRMGIMAGGDIAPHRPNVDPCMPEYCSSHDVLGLNSNVGYRRGYYGEYLFDIPENNYILVKDSAGNPAPGATISVYQGGGGALSADVVASGTTDAQGRFLLPNRPPARAVTTATGHTERANPFGTVNVVGLNATLLIEMSRPGGDFDYQFLNLIDFNLAYWAGQRQEWTRFINSRLAGNSLPRITGLSAAVDAGGVLLTWPAVPGAAEYRVYRASSYLNRPDDPAHDYENWVYKPLASVPSLSYLDTSRFETSRYAVAPVAPDGTEGPLSTRAFAPDLRNPWGIGLLVDNRRVILDPQNGFAFLAQTPAGVYVANTGSEHNHVEFSRFVAIDGRLNRMLISHPGDYYGGPHSIRVTNVNGDLDGLTDIGSRGTGPGQFDIPGGVAVDEESRIYAADIGNRRIQVFKADGSFITAFGTRGRGDGQFEEPQGVAVGARHVIYVCDQANQRVQVLKFDPATATIAYKGMLAGRTLNAPTGVAVASNGDVFVTDLGADRVEKYNRQGTWMAGYTTALYPYSGPLASPTGVAVDGLGQVIVCDTGNRRVVTVATGQGFFAADFNHDQHVDTADEWIFAACASGPGMPYDAAARRPGCLLDADTGGFLAADFDRDRDVDGDDFATLQRCWAATLPIDPGCLD